MTLGSDGAKIVSMTAPILSVVIPVNAHSSMPHIEIRLRALISELPTTENVEFIIVDHSAEPIVSIGAGIEGRSPNVIYVHLPDTHQTWSLSRARNDGAEAARGRALAFFDVDLRVAPDFWSRLIDFLGVVGIPSSKKRYIAIPCLYLTERGTEHFAQLEPRLRSWHYLLEWLHGAHQNVFLLAPCSSFIVTNRLHYLAIGGHNTSFSGHGFEDFELHHRLTTEAGLFPNPHEPYRDTDTWYDSSYKGFRARLALVGKEALVSNLLAIHLWHPRPSSNPFYGTKSRNRDELRASMQNFDATSTHPMPLVANEASRKRFLFLGSADSRPPRTLRDVFPLLGAPIFDDEFKYLDTEGHFLESNFVAALREFRVSLILLPNPYRNPARQAIYQWCRSGKFPFLIFERGALPDSWFFDDSGFQSDSRNLAPTVWNRSISDDERRSAKSYIKWCLEGHRTLEPQGPRVDPVQLKSKFRVGSEKVLLVPLQRPSDTVTVHFAGTVKSFDNFVRLIDKCAQYLSRFGWTVLCKRHPYENKDPSFEFAKCVSPDANVLDLLTIADAVAVMNSSVGLYAAMAGKPCYIFSRAFYAFNEINYEISENDHVMVSEAIRRGMNVNLDCVYRLVRHLVNDYYSFGSAKYDAWLAIDGSTRKAATSIDFGEIRVPGIAQIRYANDEPTKVHPSAPLFDQYWKTFRMTPDPT